MDLIKSDLKKLGIEHDNFFSETELIENKLVDKAINYLKKNNFKLIYSTIDNSDFKNDYITKVQKVIIAGNLRWEDSVLALGLIGLPLTSLPVARVLIVNSTKYKKFFVSYFKLTNVYTVCPISLVHFLIAIHYIFDFKSLFSNYTDKWNTNIGIYIYVYEINRSNCRVKQRL